MRRCSRSHADSSRVRHAREYTAACMPSLSRLRFALAVLLVSLAASTFAIAFRAALQLPLRWLGEAPDMGTADVVTAMRAAPLWLRVLLPTGGGLLAGLLARWVARAKEGHGVADVMEAVVLGRVRLSLRVTLLKSLASWCALATGGSLGREGPLIQFGGAAGYALARQLGISGNDVRRLIAAGTAAGFSAAYNTPFAAVLFVAEVVTGVIVLDHMVPVLIASAIADQFTRLVVGEGPVYGERAFVARSGWELLAFALLGLLGALLAQGFMRLLSWSEARFHGSGIPLPWRTALGGALCGGCIALLPEVAGNGYEPLNDVLDGNLPVSAVLWLVALKAVATSASVSSGSPGGVFTPAMLLGGGAGYAYAVLLAGPLGLAIGMPGGYALVGMAVITAATTHAPLMAAVMAFELSGDYAIVLPLVLATAVASGASHALRRDSIYGAELRTRGVGWVMTIDGRTVQTPADP
jgi:CIC family chloride channel protein